MESHHTDFRTSNEVVWREIITTLEVHVLIEVQLGPANTGQVLRALDTYKSKTYITRVCLPKDLRTTNTWRSGAEISDM